MSSRLTALDLDKVLAMHHRAVLGKPGGQIANLSYKNLAGIEIPGANLTNAILEGALLRGALLAGAFLGDAHLRYAMLAGADLAESRLCSADLREANLRGADLHGADLRGADLGGADLRGADMDGVKLRGARVCNTLGLSRAHMEDVRTGLRIGELEDPEPTPGTGGDPDSSPGKKDVPTGMHKDRDEPDDENLCVLCGVAKDFVVETGRWVCGGDMGSLPPGYHNYEDSRLDGGPCRNGWCRDHMHLGSLKDTLSIVARFKWEESWTRSEAIIDAWRDHNQLLYLVEQHIHKQLTPEARVEHTDPTPGVDDEPGSSPGSKAGPPVLRLDLPGLVQAWAKMSNRVSSRVTGLGVSNDGCDADALLDGAEDIAVLAALAASVTAAAACIKNGVEM